MPLRTPFYQVRLEGEDITPWVSSVTVTEDDRQADSTTLTIPDPQMVYSDALFEGSVAEIDMGYAEPDQHALMLRAVITKVEQSYPDNGVPTLSLKGEDRSILMGLVEENKVWRNGKVSDVVREIAQTHGFQQVEVSLTPDPSLTGRPIHQDGKTDLAFLQELAERYHAKCFVELNEQAQEVLYFIPERRIVRLRRPERLVLRYRLGPTSNLTAFSPSFDSSYIDRLKEAADVDAQGNTIESRPAPPAEVTIWPLDGARTARVSARDRARIESLYASGSRRKTEFQQQLAAPCRVVGRVTRDEAEMEARSDTLEARSLGMSAGGTTIGNIWLRAKSKVQVEGVNERFSGEWYVANVTHKIDGGGYRTDFKCVR